jgi:two-component system, NarL family, sensor histidine kinase ComP
VNLNRIKISVIWALVIGLNVWFGYVTFHYSYIGLVISPHNNEWVVTKIDPYGAAANLGIQLGDRIEKIDNHPPTLHQTVNKWAEIEQVNDILIQHNGQFQKYNIDNSNIPISLHLLFILLGDFCIFIAGLLILKFYESSPAGKLANLFAMIGLILISMRASSLDDTLAKFVVSCAVSFLPVFLAHFIFEFLQSGGHYRYKNQLFRTLYLVIFLFSLLRARYFLPYPNYEYLGIDRFINLLSFIIGVLANLVLLILFYLTIKRNKDRKLLNSIRIIWFTLALSFTPLIFFSVLPLIINGHPWINFDYSSLLTFLFPFSFLYLIFSHQLFDMSTFVYRSIFFSVSVMTQTIICTMVLLLIEKEKLSLAQLLLFAGLQSIVFGFTFCFKERFGEQLGYLFLPRKNDLEIRLKNVIQNMGGITSFNEIKEKVLEPIEHTLELKGLLLYSGKDMISQGEISLAKVRESVAKQGSSHYTVFPFGHNSFRLVITRKKSDIKLSREEYHWLNAVLTHLGVILENLSLVQRLSLKVEELVRDIPAEDLEELIWLRKTIFQVQERERERIAADLHDTIMQDIYFIKQKLSMVSQSKNKYLSNQMLMDINEHLEVVNFNLRDTCFHIYPHLLNDVGFTKAIQILVKNEQVHNPFQIKLSIEKDIENLDIEVKRHFFRIIQELLNNAKKYAFATEVKLIFQLLEGKCMLHYEDNGKGFKCEIHSNDEYSKVFTGSGLMQIKNRISSLKGQFLIRSKPHDGVKISILIPIKEEVVI